MPYDERIGPEPTGRRRRRTYQWRGQAFTCSKCGRHLPEAERGKGAWCRDCTRTYWREWARRNRDRVKASRDRKAAEARRMAEAKDRVLLRLAREDPEHFAELWEEEVG